MSARFERPRITRVQRRKELNTQPLQPNTRAGGLDSGDERAPDADVPPGDHALEVAARRGIGPLSPAGQQVWHGNARPCVTCGQLVPRNADFCDYCEQELDEDTLEKMRVHAGPWFVLEHVRPFPGVSLDRVIRQIRRGLINETSIVRGPSTDFQWRFAVEAPGLCRYFGKCWNCQEHVAPADAYCRHCLSSLSFERPRGTATTAIPPSPATVAASIAPGPAGLSTTAATPPAAPIYTPRPAVSASAAASDQLRELSAALGRVERNPHDAAWEEPPRIAGIRATWIAVMLIAVVVVVLLFLVESRSDQLPPPPPGIVGLPCL